MNKIAGLFFAAILAVGAAPALADEENGFEVTLETKYASRYIFEDLAAESSREPGVVTDLSVGKEFALIKGFLTFDWWQRADLDDGTYGNRGDGDEHDLTLTGNWEFGPCLFEAAASYWMLAPLDDADTDGFSVARFSSGNTFP